VLRRTIIRFNEAANRIIDIGFEKKMHNRFQLHRETYYQMRGEFPELYASHIISSTRIASSLISRSKFSKKPVRGKFSAVPFTNKMFKIKPCEKTISISTMDGRKTFGIGISEFHDKYSTWNIISSKLMYDKNRKTFDFGVVVRKEEPAQVENGSIVGIDRGLYNIAVTSDSEFYRSSHINAIRSRFAYKRGHD
jgi:putative transposase